MLSHANLYFSGGQAHDAAHVPGVNRQLTTLPLSHAYGLLVTIAGMHNSEQGVNVLLRWFDPATYLELIAEHRLQLSAVVPTMLQILLGMPLEDYDLSTLAVAQLRRGAAGPRGRAGVLPPRAVGLDPPGLRPHRERGAHLHQPHRRGEARLGGPPGAGHRGRDPRR